MDSFLEIFTKIPIEILDWSISYLRDVPWYSVLIFSFLILWVENVFPPAPSDTILVFCGSLVAIGNVNYFALLFVASLGSTVGFITMYYIGKRFEKVVIEKGKLPFISINSIKKAEGWFNKYGYWLIVANRFIAAIRAVISFFAGMSDLDFKKTIILSFFSSMAWYAIVIYLGYIFGDNIDHVKGLIKSYGQIVFPIVILIILFFVLKNRFKKTVDSIQ